jgi:Mn2+/Fe2+ NRAMP family transporter
LAGFQVILIGRFWVIPEAWTTFTYAGQSCVRTEMTKVNLRQQYRRFANAIGPGVITGAADDDPSGIATYSLAGAQFGTSLLWTAFLTWPLMAPVQMMCARIGMVTGDD